MKTNGKNDYFYMNYALERWNNVNNDKKDASILLLICIVCQRNNENQWGK
jgi:hypothetical protein